MPVPPIIAELVERFNLHRSEYMLSHYNETLLRRDFLDPFFTALGWDMQNERGYAAAYREVIHEESFKSTDGSRSPDYTFRIGAARKFFVEAKKPSVDITTNFDAAYQLRRYGWSATLPLSVLTNFKDFCVYDCRVPPEHGDRPGDHRVMRISCDQYVERWDEIYGIFARESILKGLFDRFADSKAPRRGTAQPDERFLAQINGWRKDLAKDIARLNNVGQAELNYAVGQTIDRLIFLRICEDRGTEKFGTLLEATKGSGIYGRLLDIFRKADAYYNSGLFYLKGQRHRIGHPDEITPSLKIGDNLLREIIKPLYEKNPYEFRFIPIEILGQVYEQFLGWVIQVEGHKADVIEKPEIKKAGGVVYTPDYVVKHIIERTVAPLCQGKTPKDVSRLRVLDPACGSGTFLLSAYDYLLQWHLDWYVKHEGPKKGRIYETQAGWRLTEAERRRILLTNIYGVDIDAQAVEVTKLSLLLKLLEGASKEALELQFRASHEPALPDLDGNIRAGNALIASDFYDIPGTAQLDIASRRRVNAFDWDREFETIMSSGGFDAVVGNPPYVLLQQDFKEPLQYEYFHKHYLAAFKVDLYHLFIERAIRLTKAGGYCSLITPSNYLTNNYMAGLRRFMVENGFLENVTVIDGRVFQRRSVDTAVFNAKKSQKRPQRIDLLRAKAAPGLPTLSTLTVRTANVLASEEVLFTGGNDDATALWGRLSKACNVVSSIAYVNFGKQLRDREEFPEDVIKLGAIEDMPDGYAPCYTGEDVSRYAIKWSGLACRTDRAAKRGGCWDASRQDQINKLLTRQIGFWPEFGIDVNGFQCLNTAFMVNVKSPDIDPFLLMGILNSKVLRAFWLDKYYDRRRTFPKIKGTYIEKLPVPKSLSDPTGEISSIYDDLRSQVGAAIDLRRQIGEANPREIEFLRRECDGVDRAIDALVCRLYNLSDEEIAIVDRIVEQHLSVESAFKKGDTVEASA